MPSPAWLFDRFLAAGTNERLDLSLSWRAFEDPLKRPYIGYDQGPEIHSKPRRVSLLVREEVQPAGCLKNG